MSVKRVREFPTVALVGRTNVGKSTFWNRLTETGRALVSAEAHTTRDRNFGFVAWKGMTFELVDTGGMDVEADVIGEGIRQQSEQAIREADLVLFLVDARAGVLPQDQELARVAKKLNPHIWLVANKVDKASVIPMAHDSAMYKLTLGEPHPISAATSLGIGDLLDEIFVELERLGHPPQQQTEKKPLHLAFIGRPNVGKSSLVNAILGEPRVIVSPIAHTTREPQDTPLRYKDHDLLLVDTAGMRKMAHVKSGVEEMGIERNLTAIADADVAFLIFDVTADPTAQDRHLAGYLEDTKKGLILVANKWDLVQGKTTHSTEEYEELIRQLFPFLNWAPLVFTSALTGQRATELLDLALKVEEERHRHIDYNALNKLLKACIKTKKPLASYGPRSPRIYDVAQLGQAPPEFLVTVIGEKESIHPSWIRFFEKRLRQKFGFEGTPLKVKVRTVPLAKSLRSRNVQGPGYEAVAGKISEYRRVNQTRKRQKGN